MAATRSHSPPLPPNAAYTHPTITLNILPSATLFTAGTKLTGVLELTCKKPNTVALGQLAVEFVGIEELKLLDHSAQSSIHGPHKCIFQGPALPPSNAVAASEAPIAGHYYTALRGRTKFPFSFPLPSKLPSSTNFGDKARASYALKATCQVLAIDSRQNVLVTKAKTIQIVERLLDWNDNRYHEPVEMRGELRDPSGSGAGVWAELKIPKILHFSLLPDNGLIHAQLTVKNNSRRTLSGGVNAKICRKLVLPHHPAPSAPDPSRIHVVRTSTFRGPEFEFPSGQPKTVSLLCQLPSPAAQDDIPSAISVRALKLFSVDMFLRVELELGALSNDLVIDLPIYVTHPSSLPKELLLRTQPPKTIEHVRSTNAMSLLTKPDGSSGRASRASSRCSSPHPPSLQPGGNISRSGSPRLSLAMPGGDWGGRSAPPSPAGSAHFSPLPTPQPSPEPSPRFASPMSFDPHYPSAPAGPPGYFPPPPAWPQPSSATAYQDQQFSPYPATPGPSHDPRSHAPYPPPQPLFSPPTTPWHRPPASSPFDPAFAYAPATQPGDYHPHSTDMPPIPPAHPQEPFSPAAYHAYDPGSPMPSHWRTRHQSLPAAPGPPSHHYRPPDTHHDAESVFEGALSRKPSSSRRTSEPISPFSGVQPVSGGLVVRKRALPVPPQQQPPAAGPAHPESLSSHHAPGLGSPASPDPAPGHARLATIGESGESRPGTVRRKTHAVLAGRSADSSSSGEDDGSSEALGARRPARVVSHPHAVRPRRSDGSDSVQALEDFVALEDDQRRCAERARAASSPSPPPLEEPDRTPTLASHHQPGFLPSYPAQTQEHRPPLQPPAEAPLPAERLRSADSRALSSGGLANLVQLLNRAASVEPPPRASSVHDPAPSHADGARSAAQDPEEDGRLGRPPGASSSAATGASALRIKSCRISFAHEALIDAVPSPPPSSTSSPTKPLASVPAPAPTCTPENPPVVSGPARASLSAQISLCDDDDEDEPTEVAAAVARLASVAPAALFAHFDPARPSPSSPPSGAAPASAGPSSLMSPDKPHRKPSVVIPSVSPVVKKKAPRKSPQTRKPSGPAALPPAALPAAAADDDCQPSIVDRLRRPNPIPNPGLSPASHRQSVAPPASAPAAGGGGVSAGLGPTKPAAPPAPSTCTPPLLPMTKTTTTTTTRTTRTEDSADVHRDWGLRSGVDTMLSSKPDPPPSQPPPPQPPLSQPPLPQPPLPQHRLSAIPKSAVPLAIPGLSRGLPSSGSGPHRPLPISPGSVHLARLAQAQPPHPMPPQSMPPQAMPPQSMPPQSQPAVQVGVKEPAKPASHLDSPTSPTYLSRKSRIKRQMSSTPNTIDESTILSKRRDSRIGGVSSSEEGGRMFSINRVPGGWNEEESNEIEAQLIEALRQTNLAVHKATHRRLSTPQFVKSPAKSWSSIRSSLYSTSSQIAGVPAPYDRLRASVSIGGRTSEESVGSSVDRAREPPASRASLDWPSTSQTEESAKWFDEDAPIRLTSEEYKSMRGGRGGRVSSVVGQWAKLTAAGDDGQDSPRKKNPETAEQEEQQDMPASVSTRGLSIRPKNISHPSQYSIAGFLSRNASLTSQFSSPRVPAEEPRTDGEPAKLPSAPAFQTPAFAAPRRVLPAVPLSTTATTTMRGDENKGAGAAKQGYRNLANRLSGTAMISRPHQQPPAAPSASSSTSSVSSLADSASLRPHSLDPPRLKPSHRPPAAASRPPPLLRSLNSASNRPFSDLVKRWEA